MSAGLWVWRPEDRGGRWPVSTAAELPIPPLGGLPTRALSRRGSPNAAVEGWMDNHDHYRMIDTVGAGMSEVERNRGLGLPVEN